MAILEEEGYFCWTNSTNTDVQNTVNCWVPGLLKVDDKGIITLKLRGCLQSDTGGVAAVSMGKTATMRIDPKGEFRFEDDLGKTVDLKNKSIRGVLNTYDEKYVLLLNIFNLFDSHNIIGLFYQECRATNCFIGKNPFPETVNIEQLRELEIDLSGLEEWLGLRSIQIDIDIERREGAIKYSAQPTQTWNFDNWQLRLETFISGAYAYGNNYNDHNISLKEIATLTICSNEPRSSDEMKSKFELFEEFFIIILNSEYFLRWPSVSFMDGDNQVKYRWYFHRMPTSAAAPKDYECLIGFKQIELQFGQLISNWMTQREGFGPGFYLYLALRREMPIYSEHRFVNLIWGLEAFHRKKYPNGDPALKDKIQRILENTKGRDKHWLKCALRNKDEPSLKARISVLLKALPIKFDEGKVCSFAEACADRRNDLSHPEEGRTGDNYFDFQHDIETKSDILMILYYVMILHEIGVDEKIINYWLWQKSDCFDRKRILGQAGLTPLP